MAAVLAGPPYALARLTGWPLPRHPPAWSQVQAFLTSPLSDDAIISVLAGAVWLLWAVFAAVGAHRGDSRRWPGAVPHPGCRSSRPSRR